MDPHQYCQDKAAASGSSFYYSFRFLPPERRRAITALYAYCREVDDIVDECSDSSVARSKLIWWRSEVGNIFAGNPQHPVAQALVPVVREFNMPQELFLEIIDGMEMDLNQSRYVDFKALQLYCYRVASVVGLLAAEIFGYQNRQTLKYAHDLGIALQLTNILRDVGEDARRGRIYLPLDELEAHGVSPAQILSGTETPALMKVLAIQAERAKTFYQQAFAQLPAEDRRPQRPGLIMGRIYRTLLDEIERDGYHVLNQRIALTPLRKLWIAWKTWVTA